MELLLSFLYFVYGVMCFGVLTTGITFIVKGKSIFEGWKEATICELFLCIIFSPIFVMLSLFALIPKIIKYQPFKRK
jgi:uncharacterized membrane protein YGL010W